MTRETTAIRKISSKTVVGKIPNPPEKGVRPLWQVIGQATGVKAGTTQFGEFQALVGVFEAVNVETGEVFEAPQCFLPEPQNGAIATKLLNGNATAVEFALEIGIKAPGAGSQQRYEYTCKTLREAGESDPLDGLRRKLPALLEDKSKGRK